MTQDIKESLHIGAPFSSGTRLIKWSKTRGRVIRWLRSVQNEVNLFWITNQSKLTSIKIARKRGTSALKASKILKRLMSVLGRKILKKTTLAPRSL